MTNDELLDAAAGTLGLTVEEARGHCKELPEIGAWYFWASTRGDKAVIIDNGGSRLVAPSSINFKEHVAEWQRGRRN